MNYLIGIILGLATLLFFQKRKADSAESLLTNLDVKQKTNEIDKSIAQNQGTLDSEAQKREELNKKLQEEEKAKNDIKDLEDFFNNGGNKSS